MPGFPPIGKDSSIGPAQVPELAMDIISVAIGGDPPDQRVQKGTMATLNLDVIVASDPLGELPDVAGDLDITIALEPWKGATNYVQQATLHVDGADLLNAMPTTWEATPKGYRLQAADYGGDYTGCHLYRLALSIATDDPNLNTGDDDYSVHLSIKKGTLAYKGTPYAEDAQAWYEGPVITIYV